MPIPAHRVVRHIDSDGKNMSRTHPTIKFKNGPPMLTVPERFKEYGFDLQQIKREGRVVLFKRWKERIPTMQPHYDLVILRVAKEHTFPNGKTYPEREVMPTNEQWGTYGWSYVKLEDAEKNFALRVELERQKEAKA